MKSPRVLSAAASVWSALGRAASFAVLVLPAFAGCDETSPSAGASNAASSASSLPEASAAATDAIASVGPGPVGTPDAAAAGASATATATTASTGTDTATAKDAGKPPEGEGKDAGGKKDGGAKEKDAGLHAATDSGAPDASGEALTQRIDGGAPDAGGSELLPAPAAGSADAIAAEIDGIYVGKKTFSARFKQEHTQKVSGMVKKSQGVVFVEKPNKISFRYDPPNRNRIVSDGTTLKIYIAEDEQMFVQPVTNTEYPGALSFLMGRGLRPSFTFAVHDKAKFAGGPVLLGTPRVPTPYYQNVIFYVDKVLLAKSDPGTVRRVLILDAQGNKNRFDFEGATHPASIDPGEFLFSPPPGTQVKQ